MAGSSNRTRIVGAGVRVAITHKEKKKWSRSELSIPKCDDIYCVLMISGSKQRRISP